MKKSVSSISKKQPNTNFLGISPFKVNHNAIIVFLAILIGCLSQTVYSQNIISEKNGVPVMENSQGCRLILYFENGTYGLGSFYLEGVKIGETIPYFMVEESDGVTYKANEYVIIKNTAEVGKIRFTGVDSKLKFAVTITLMNNSNAYTLDYEFYNIHPIYHPLYLNVPFSSKKADFIKYPYEATLAGNYRGRWVLQPDRGRVPFLFGCQKTKGQPCFVGVGYNLEEDFTQGRFEYDPAIYPESAMKIFTPFQGMARPNDLQCVTRLEQLRVDLDEELKKIRKDFRVIISTANNQYDCIRSYEEFSGFDPDIKLRRSIDHSVLELMKLYKTVPGYVKGKGYHQLIRFDNGIFDTTIPHGWYSKYIVAGPQVQLAYELYRYWKNNPGETWARERAIEMADFLIEMQAENGAFTNWDTDNMGQSVMHPEDTEGNKFAEQIYTMSDIGNGTFHLYKLYTEMKDFEGIDMARWKEAAVKAARYMTELVGGNGEMGRIYSKDGYYDKQTACLGEVLLALNYTCQQTQDEEIGNALERLEKWLYETHIKNNNWANGSADGGAWQGSGWPPPHNNDNMGTLTFATYCAYRHMQTGEERYLQMGKDVIMYQWLTAVPIQIPGIDYSTKGLQREQDFYSAFDIPIKGKEITDCLTYFSKVTGDPFFMKYFRMMIQTNMDYQAMDETYAGFRIGLESDETGREPMNQLAESKVGYIVRFASIFLKAVTNENTYSYVGGLGWGIGLDYNLSFDPDFGEEAPYVLCTSTLVRDMTWDNGKKTLKVALYDINRKQGILEIKWKPDLHPINKAKIIMNGKPVDFKAVYNPQKEVITIPYKHDSPTLVFDLQCL